MPSDLPFCPNCGSRNESGALFCGDCGRSMDEIIPDTFAAGPPAAPAPEHRSRPWMLRLGTVAAVIVVAAVIASGQSVHILNSLKRATSPSPGAQPAAPVSPPPAAPAAPPPAARSAAPAPPQIAVTNFELTSFTAGAAPGGLRVAMNGMFALSGASPQTTAQVAPVWIVRGGQRLYGSFTKVPVKNGPVKVTGAAVIPRLAASDYVDISLAVRIAGQEFISPAKGLVVASVVPAPGLPVSGTPTPQPPPKPLTPAPVPPLPRPPVPSQPVAPTPPAPPLGPTPAAAVTDLKLSPASSLTVAPEETVSFNLTFVLAASPQTAVESAVVWRGPDGALHYGRSVIFPAAQGANALSGLTFTVMADTPLGTVVPVYGALKVDGRIYRTESPVRVTVAGVSRATPPAGQVPPRQPPSVQPLSPRFARGAICGFWHSDFGDVTFRCTSPQDEGPVQITGTFRRAPGRWGTITSGTFDPGTGIVTFTYYAAWVNVTGSARLTLEPGGTRLSGTWQQPDSNGTWTMWR